MIFLLSLLTSHLVDWVLPQLLSVCFEKAEQLNMWNFFHLYL